MIHYDCLSESEIWMKYKQADDPDAMVSILADLTGCTRKEMEKHLGHTHTRKRPPNEYHAAKDNRFALYKAGKTDREISALLNISLSAVRSWRNRHRLQQNGVVESN